MNKDKQNKFGKDKWLFFVIAPLMLLILSLLIENYVRHIVFSNNTENSIADLASKIENSNYNIALNNIDALSSLNFIKNTVTHNKPIDNEECLAALLATRDASQAEMVYLLDRTGQVVACTPNKKNGQTFTGKNFAFRPYFKNALNSNNPVFYPAVGVVSNTRGLYLSIAITDSSKKSIGVAVIKTGLTKIDDKLKQFSAPAAIVSPDGIVYASNNNSWLFKSIKPINKNELLLIHKSKQFANHKISQLKVNLSGKNTSIDGIDYTLARNEVFGGGWSVIALHEKPSFNSFAFLISLVSLMVFLSGFYFALRISTKLKKANQLITKQNEYSNRIINQQEAIIHLNKSQIQLKNWDEVQGIITETGAKVLNIERASLWLFNNEGNKLICVDRFLKSRNEHESGQEISEEMEPRYFQMLKSDISIVSDHIYDDTFLSGLIDPIFKPKNIVAILHVPILQQNKPIGVICLENIGGIRHWNRDERVFAERLANRVSLFLVIQERRKTAEKLKKSNQELKLALEEAKKSKELEKANIALRDKEQRLLKAFDDIKEQQTELTKLNNKLAASHSYTLDLNNELVNANETLEKQKTELLDTLKKLKDTQSQLIQAEKMVSLGILTAGIAHEINNPLNFIQGGKTALELHINDHYKNEEEAFKPMFDMIDQGINRATEIVKSLNHFNRSSEKSSELCNLHAIIDNCLVMLHNQLKHRIEINKVYTSSNFTLTGNEGKLHQLFLNIIGNAEQAINGSGTIHIETRLNGSYIKTIISDNGHGIKEEHMQKIMDPFFTTKSPGKGTGLGLSIVHNIIQDHNGLIEYESKPNEGTKVTVSLPLN